MADGIAAKGGSIDALASDKGTTALMLAAGAGHAEVVALLLAAGCDPSLRNQFGDTALKMAAAAKHAKVLALLPGGLHDFDHVNAKSTPCISCQRVVGAGRAGVFCIACRRCRACAESLECEAGRTTTRIKNGSQVCSHSAHHLPRLALTAACDLGRLREA